MYDWAHDVCVISGATNFDDLVMVVVAGLFHQAGELDEEQDVCVVRVSPYRLLTGCDYKVEKSSKTLD